MNQINIKLLLKKQWCLKYNKFFAYFEILSRHHIITTWILSTQNCRYLLPSNEKNTNIGREKPAFRMGENDSKQSNWQRINVKNIQEAPAAQFQKNKWLNQKMGQRTKQTFLQRRHTDG